MGRLLVASSSRSAAATTGSATGSCGCGTSSGNVDVHGPAPSGRPLPPPLAAVGVTDPPEGGGAIALQDALAAATDRRAPPAPRPPLDDEELVGEAAAQDGAEVDHASPEADIVLSLVVHDPPLEDGRWEIMYSSGTSGVWLVRGDTVDGQHDTGLQFRGSRVLATPAGIGDWRYVLVYNDHGP